MVTVVIVSFNTADLLAQCLTSVYATADGLVGSVVVVDNASADGSVALVQERFPDVTLLALQANVGFAAACNLAAAQADDEFVLLLNPDAVLRPGCLAALVDALRRRPEAGIMGGRTLNADGSLNPSSCFGLPSLWSTTCFALGLSTAFAGHRRFDPESLGDWARDTEREVGMVTGCLLLCRRALWDQLGGLDPQYFVYGEDADFAFRVRRAGYRPHITPAAECLHLGGASSPTSAAKWRMLLRGKVSLLHRQWPRRQAALGVRLLMTGALLRAVVARCGGPVKGPWQENWRDRADWVGGWEAEPGLPRPIQLRELPTDRMTG